MTIHMIRNAMNEFGNQRRPFLFVIDYALKKGIFLENPLNQNEILFATPLGSNFSGEKPSIKNLKLDKFPMPFSEYEKQFDKILKSLNRGDSYLTNLTVKTPINVNLSLLSIFKHSNSLFNLYIPDKFVCFSPERFVKISNGIISTNPMKGTISADIANAEKLILENQKEAAEHATIVDLLRNDLSQIAENVEVKRYRYIDNIKFHQGNLLQVSSEITGKIMKKNADRFGDIIFSLLPAGSISGAPKKSTLKIIKDTESYNRGYYTGVFGYYDGNELDSGVLIRFIGQEGEKKYFYSGGGITDKSNAKSEYEEMLKKIYLPF